ncbi:MAG: hypothetical protein R2772_01270 [Chitinophagales bacterium]
MKYIPLIASILFAAVLTFSCAKHNAGIVKQSYHDLTSHYNAYFNANENFNVRIGEISKSRKENYKEILPLYAYGSLDELKNQSASLNSTIEKARLSIQTHQEKEKSKAYIKDGENSISNWSDNAFVLIGKSYYLQGSLDSAISCFRYVTANFDDGVDARSKDKIKKQNANKKRKEKAKKLEEKQIELAKEGKDIRPKNKIGLHEASKSEALVWLVKAFASNQDYADAEAVLTYTRGDQSFIRNYDKDLELANAFLYLEQNQYEEAIPYLESAVEKIKKQKNKTRYQFILGQLHEETKHKAIAADYYKKSMKANSNFDMIFYAKLKLIQMSRGGNYNSTEAEKLLAKMLKDSKNRDFYDQLYYEKALLALDDQDREAAKKYFHKSIAVSTSNSEQKGISYLALANMNYEEEAYAKSQALYDSSLALLSTEHPEYELASNRSKVLNELVMQLNTIALNDSLLTLANIPSTELEAYLYKMAVDEIDAQIKLEEKNKQADLLALSNTSTSGKSDKNAWYFYSDASRNSGYKKFKQKWGDIALEDNWRRSDKSADNSNPELANDTQEDAYFSKIDSRYEEMLAAIPKTSEQKKALENAIIDAYYEGAVVYKVGLENLPKSIEMFETLNKRFPSNLYEPENLYQLYILYAELDNQAKAKKCKEDLLNKYPNSEFAAYIKNPESISKEEDKSALENYYQSAYDLYESEDYDACILKCEDANQVFPDNEIQAKFDLLKAMCIGGKKLLEPFMSSLEYVVITHNASPEKEKAEEILAYLRGEVPEDKPSPEKGKLIKDASIDDKIPVIERSMNEDKDLDTDLNKGLKLKLGEKELNIGGKNGPQKKDE